MLRADFTSMSEVRRVAAEITAMTPRLDVLINNAGGVRDQLIMTNDGTEATFAANHLAPFLLTKDLLPILKNSAATLTNGAVRVIGVSSSGHHMSQGWDWDDLQSVNNFTASGAYCQAKLANIMFARELNRRVGPEGLVAQVMHPGRVNSNFASHGDAGMRAYMATAETVAPDEPAETQVWLATDPEGGTSGGRYFFNKAEETPSAVAQDDDAAARLWVETEALLASLGY